MWNGYGPKLASNNAKQPNDKLLADIRELARTDMSKTLEYLVTLSEPEFAQIVDAQERLNKWTANHLIHHPKLMPNQVPRARRISQARLGMPWWLIEAQYRRLRF